jgi:hydrogenase maturation protease
MKVRIIGVGNVFMSDDGFGPAVARMLEAFYEMPPSVTVIDGGVPGFVLTPHLMDSTPLIVVHAAPGDGQPGQIRVRRAADGEPGTWPVGNPELIALSVVPEWVATGVTLSRTVRSAIAPVVGLVITELERLGVAVPLRVAPRTPDFWWDSFASAHRSIGHRSSVIDEPANR